MHVISLQHVFVVLWLCCHATPCAVVDDVDDDYNMQPLDFVIKGRRNATLVWWWMVVALSVVE